MASSFANPKITNQIASDVPAIQELLGYLAQCRPDFGTNYPANSIRIFLNTDGWSYIQRYNGSAWENMSKFNFAAASLNGYTVSSSAAANKIPIYNAQGQLVGSITGNAPTATKLATARSIQVGGILSSTAQNFDGSANVTIPVNQVTINNSADNAVNGTLTVKHGGTGRTDGASQNVVVDSIAGAVLAKSYGQIGRAIWKGDVDFNTLTVDGWYQAQTTTGNKLHQPNKWNVRMAVHVSTQGTAIIQDASCIYGRAWRYSLDSGASWGRWYYAGHTTNTITLYVSKSGNDLNNGMESDYPVLTISRVFEIASGIFRNQLGSSYVKLCVGAGNWDLLNALHLPYFLDVFPYDGANPTAYSSSLPVFNELRIQYGSTVRVNGVVCNYLNSQINGWTYIGIGYKRFGRILSNINSHVYFQSQNAATNVTEFMQISGVTNSACIHVSNMSSVDFQEYQYIGLATNITSSGHFLHIDWSSQFHCRMSLFNLKSSSYKFSGKKCWFAVGSRFSTVESTQGAIPTNFLSKLPGTEYTIEIGAIINGYPYGVLPSNKYLAKAGDSMIGDLTLQAKMYQKNFNDSYNVTPSAIQYWERLSVDKNNATISNIYTRHGNNGKTSINIQVRSENGTSIYTGPEITNAGVGVFNIPVVNASSNEGVAASTSWVRALLTSNSANEIPVGAICAYEGAFTRASDAIDFYAQEIKELEEKIKNDTEEIRYCMARSRGVSHEVEEEIGLLRQKYENERFKSQSLLDLFKDLCLLLPEKDTVRGTGLYDAAGNPLGEEINYPMFHITFVDGQYSRAFPSTKWQQYTPGARCLIGTDSTHAYGSTGGSSTHNHSAGAFTFGSTTLATTQIPSHNHKVNIPTLDSTAGAGNPLLEQSSTKPTATFAVTATNTGGGGGHTHSISQAATGSTSTYPPYKVVYWIKKKA